MVQQVEALLILDGKIDAGDLGEGFDDALEVGSDGVMQGGVSRRTLKGQRRRQRSQTVSKSQCRFLVLRCCFFKGNLPLELNPKAKTIF